MRPLGRRLTAATMALLAGLAAGCASVPEAATVSFYRAGDDAEAPRRLLILPFLDESGPNPGTDSVEKVFTSELMKRGRFDVVTAPPNEAEAVASREVRLRGTYPLPALTDLADRYRADAILLGSVTDHRPYPPLRLGLRVEMISTRTGRVLWSADALFDAADRTTRRAITAYHDRVIASTGSLMAADVLLVSMDKFTRFACHEVARTIDRKDGARRVPASSPAPSLISSPPRPAETEPSPSGPSKRSKRTRPGVAGSSIGGCF